MVPNGKRWSMLSIAIGCYVSSITRQDSVWDGDAVIADARNCTTVACIRSPVTH